MRCPQRPSCGRSRSGVFPSLRDPRVRGRLAQRRRPCGFTPCEHDAVKLDMRTCRLRVLHASSRRANATATRARNVGNVFDRCAEMAGATDAILRRNDPSHQAPPLRSFAARSWSCIAAFSWRDVPLPAASLRGLAERLVLPSGRPAALLGFIAPFAGLLPRRVIDHLGSIGPTCLFVQPPAPIDFRRVDLAARQDA
jgi:hypothetical protein